jgi:DNA topoisomerase VI subunit B
MVASTCLCVVPLQITKHHPSSVDLELVKRLITETKASSLSTFLTREFDQVSKALAGRLIGELRSGGVSASTDPKQLSSQQVVRLHQLLHEVGATFDDRLIPNRLGTC